MEPSTPNLQLKPKRSRLVLTWVYVLLFATWAAIRATQLLQRKELGPSILGIPLFVILSIFLLVAIRVSIHGFYGFHVATGTGVISVVPFVGRSFDIHLYQIAGYSASRVGWGRAMHAGIILYVPSRGHFEMSDYTHPGIASLVQLIKARNIPYLGHERSWWLFLKYRFDPK